MAQHSVAFAPGTGDENIGHAAGTQGALMSEEMEEKYGGFRTLYSSRKSQVYRASEKGTGETVVVKVYKKKELRPHEVRQVQRERILFMQIDHTFLIKGLATFECPRAFYLIQEFASRGDLCDIASAFSRRCIPEHHVIKKIAGPMLKGLTYLHARHIIHRDIKPENVLVMEDGTVKLCDFGLAVNSSVDVPVSRVGTLEFMAPEVVRLKNTPQDTLKAREEGVPLYGTGVDVWSTGCVIFEMLFGVSPFTDTDRQRIEINILSQPLTIPTNPPISEPVSRFISATLVRSPLARMSAEQLLELPVFTTGIGSDEPQPSAGMRSLPRRFSAPYKPMQQMQPRGPDNASGSQFVAGSHYGDVESMDTAADTAASPGSGGAGAGEVSSPSSQPASGSGRGAGGGGFLSNTMRFFGGAQRARGKKEAGGSGAPGGRDASPIKTAPVRSSLITGRRSMPRAVHLPPEVSKTSAVEKRLGRLGFGGT